MDMDRRDLIRWLAGATTVSLIHPFPAWGEASNEKLLKKKIPSTGTMIPVIGMGTWITFNVGEDKELRDARTKVLKEFFSRGGGVIDSSPMYGSSEAVLGYGLEKLGHPGSLFSATKVWTDSVSEGKEQYKASKKLWGVDGFDLYQVHNLQGWKDHLKILFERKKEGDIKHVGVTTSHGRRHDELAKIMRTQPIDFVQLTYNLVDREAEDALLKLAKDKGIAVIANRPFRGGSLVDRLQNKPFPKWAKKFDCANWPQFLLKYIVSHPAVTCAIPATTQVVHMKENMGAATGKLPDPDMRKRMAEHVASL